jgi:hypothetical protein
MESRIRRLMLTLIAALAVSANAYAGCTTTQLAGAWDVVFSDGNSCRLVVDKEGAVLIEADMSQSTCFDPFRGATVPDEGSYSVNGDCSVSFELVVEGANVELYGRVIQPRIFGTGFFVTYIPDVFATKGSFNMVRAK